MRRALVVAALVAATLAKAEVVEIEGYEWEHRPDLLPSCERVVWVQRSWDEVRAVCGAYACAGPLSGGMPACHVVSGYSEAEARHVKLRLSGGESLYEHEARHVLERFVHPGKKFSVNTVKEK